MKIRLVLLSCLIAITALAADVTGKWTAEVPGRNGNTRTQTITLKADGSKLTGSVGGQQGDTAIQDGKIDGNNVTFTVTREFNGNTMKMNYTGTVAGDEIKFKVTREGADRTQEFTAKRATT